MLNSQGFDLWADDYDESVALADENGDYPFAGYRRVLGGIYEKAIAGNAQAVLDIGIGTGVLAARLYARGCDIYGQDFSGNMLQAARRKMPKAKLYRGDIALGLVDALRQNQYDAIIATYSLHHLTDTRKVGFISGLLPLLREGGGIYIGDVAFETRQALAQCRKAAGDAWDAAEHYFVFDETRRFFPKMRFEQLSHCAGILTLREME